MISLDNDLLSLEFAERDVEVPIDARDESKGCVIVRIREIPYAIKKSLDVRSYAAFDKVEQAREVYGKIASHKDVTPEEISSVGAAFGSVRDAQLEVIKWAVCGHNEKDFLVKGAPTPFESVDIVVSGVRYSVASPRMLRLYSLASPESIDALHTSFIANLAHIARQFQVGTIPTPKEIWDAART